MIESLAGYKLYPYQREACDYVKGKKYSLLALDMGLGKSLISLWSARELEANKILIICPASITGQWYDYCKKTHPDFFIEVMDGKNLSSQFYKKFILIVSYNRAGTDGTKRQLLKLKYDFAILDEMHFLKNPDAKRTKVILGGRSVKKNEDGSVNEDPGSFLVNAQRICLMSGTPILNRPIEAYMVLKTFAPKLLGKYLAWPTFIRRFCGFQGKGCTRPDELSSILSTFMLRRTKEEVLHDLPDIVENTVYVSGIRDYIDEFLPTRRKLVSIGKSNYIIEYTKDLLQTIEKVVLVLYHTETIQNIEQAFPGQCVVLKGGLTQQEKQKRLHQFKTDPNITLCIGQISVIGTGVDGLQDICNYMIFGELDWSPGTIEQAKDRLRRIGQKKTVFIHYIIAKGTIEEDIDLKLEWKREVIKSLVIPTKSEYNIKENPLEQHFNALVDHFAQKVAEHLHTLQGEQTSGKKPTKPKPSVAPTPTPDTIPVALPISPPAVLTSSVDTSCEVVSGVDKDQLKADIKKFLSDLKATGVSDEAATNFYKTQVLAGLNHTLVDHLDERSLNTLRAKMNTLDASIIGNALAPVTTTTPVYEV